MLHDMQIPESAVQYGVPRVAAESFLNPDVAHFNAIPVA
jgi:hypothetical protein